MSTSNEWLVAVFESKSVDAQRNLVEFYRFVDRQKGVRSLHFLLTDRIEDKVVFSFRVMVEPKLKENAKAKLAIKLGSMFSADQFAIDPTANSKLNQYALWSPEKRLAELGQTSFNLFVDSLKSMSSLAVELLERGSDRVEMVRNFALMLGCTEYGLLGTSGFEVGYYDRLEDKYASFLRQDFKQVDKE